MANGVIGGELNISGLEEGINKIEKKLTNLSRNLSTNSTRIIDAFREISTQGVDTLVGKLDELNATISKINVGANLKDIGTQATASIDGVNRLTEALKAQSEVSSNQKVKENAIASRKAYEDQLRMYEKMFDTAEANRPDLVKKGDTLQEINLIDTRLTELMSKIHKLNNEMQLFKSMESGQTLHTEDYAYIGKVADELKKLIAEYEALYNKRGQLQQQLKTYKTEEEQLAQAQANQRKNQEKNTTFEGAKEFSEKATNINRQKKAIEYLTQARAKLNLTTYEGRKKAQELTDAIAQHEKELKRATQSTEEYRTAQRKLASKRLEHIYSVSPNLALNYSQQAKSINEQILAIKRLKSARDNLNRGNFASEEAYRKKIEQLNDEIKRQQTEVDKLTNKNANLGKSHRHLMDTAGQLQRKLALLFSVSAIQGYVNKLITVRGEFELQAKSLEVLLQNKDEANRLWNQTVQLAVKSPFTVKELVSYTKQLAAYRIESDKLYETNKMLADVSAGLGVDMGRLILAFGQVKAANFLRGTELRQFSEAGVNMLGELAKYFTELEGRAVSVGDVFERISKRMVTFADVETVFKRITSAGGTFYQMQEKQAETTRGMISNLKDSIDIMLNDIGQAHDGTIKNMLDLVRTLVENWRMLAPILTNVSFTLAAVYATKGIGTLITNIKDAHKAFRLLQRTIKNTGFALRNLNRIPMGGWMALIGVLASVGMAIYQVATATDELTEELTRLNSEGEKEMYKMIAKYKELADASQDVTKSEEERKQALKDLEHTFKNILPLELRREEYIKGLAGHYDEATRAMRQHYNESIALQKKEAIESYYVKEIVKNTADLKNDFFDLIVKAKENGAISDKLANNLKLGFEGAISKTIADIKSGKITSDRESLLDSLYENLFNYAEVPRAQREQLRNELMKYIDVLDLVKNFIKLGNLGQAKLNIWEVLGVDKNAYELAGNISDLNDQMLGVTGIFDETATDRVLREQTERVKESVDVIFNEYEKLEKIGQASIGKDEKAIDDAFKIDFNKAIENIRKKAPQYEQAFIDAISKLKKASATNTIEFGTIIPDIRDSLNKEVANILKSYNSNVASMPVIAPLIDFDLKTFDSQLSSASNSIETLNGAILDTKTQAEITNTAVQSYAQTLEKSFDDKKLSTSQKAIVELFRFAVDKYGGSMEDLKKFNVTASTSTGQMANDVNNYLELVTESINNYNKGLQNLINAGKDYEEAVQIMVNSTGKSAEDIKRLETVVKPILQLIVAVLNPALLKKGNKSGADPFSKQLDVVRKLNTEYKSLLKTFEKTESATILVNKLGDAFEEAFGRKLTTTEVESDDFITNLYDELNKKAKNKKQKIQVKLAKGEDEIEVRIKAKENETKKFIDDIQKKIDKYELSVELDKIGIPKDIAKSLFGIEATDLAKIKKDLEKQISDLQQAGGSEDRIKALQAELDKVNEMEAKAQVERLKDYSKYLYKAMSKRTQITLDQLKKEKEIEKTFVLTEDVAKKNNWVDDTILESLANAKIKLSEIGITAEETIDYWKKLGFTDEQIKRISEYNDMMRENQELAKKGVALDSQKALEKLQWDEFKGSEMYEQLFGDLEQLGTKTIDILISKLTGMKDTLKELPTEVYKEIQNSISKLEGLKIERNPFKEFSKSLEEIKKLNKITVDATYDVDGKTVTKKLKGEDAIAYQLQQKEEEIAKQRELIRLIEYAKGVEDGTVATRDKSLDALAQNNGLFEEGVNLAKKLNDAESELTAKEGDAKSLGLNLKQYEAFRKALEGVKAKTILWADSIKDVLSGFDAVLDAFGVAEDSTTRLWIQNAIKIADMIAQVIILTASLEAMGVAANSALGIIGWIAMALQAVAMLMASIFGYQDKKQQKEIERLERQVRKLESAYKDLERAMDRAYEVGSLKNNYNMAIQNINSQIVATQRMMNAERDKKDTDKGKLLDYEEKLKELNQQKKELLESKVTDLGGSYDIRGTTREFVEAWIDAFNETGDGLSGLKDNFKEFFKNILIEQAVMKGAGTIMQPLLDEINKSLEDDFKLSNYEMEGITKTAPEVMQALDNFLTSMFGEHSPLRDWISESADNLTGLQKGIQGITESQADIIAAYLNSMRAYVADNNLKLTQMLDAWTNTEVENPMVAQLKIIATQTTAIHDLLGGLTKGGHSEGGKGLKVFIN